MKKVLFTATVVKKHIMQFHVPYLKMLKEMGFETYVAAKNDYEDPDECNIPYCDHYIDIPFERNPVKPENSKAYRQLKKLIDHEQFALIHTHTPVGAFLTRMAARDARKKGTKVIYTAHGFHFFNGAPMANWMLYYPAEKFASRFTDVLITINQEDFLRAQKFHAKRVCYVPGVGIDLNRFHSRTADKISLRARLGLEPEKYMFLSVGELNKNKNHILVIKTLAELKDPSLKYIICGEGPLREKLEQTVRDLGLQEQVLFTGYTREVSDFYACADLYIFPSFREGLSLSLMEAIAARLPVICSDIRGNKDLILNEQYRFSPENPQEFRLKLDQALHSDLSQEADENYRNIQRFELNNVLCQVKHIYEDCL